MVALVKVIDVEKSKALVSVKWLDQHRVMRESVGPKSNLMYFKGADVWT